MNIRALNIRLIICIIFTTILFSTSSLAQYNGYDFSISGNFNFTTNSKIYLFPKSADSFLRNTYSEIENITSPSLEIRYRISDAIIIGLGAEILEKTHQESGITIITESGVETVSVEDGFRIVPFEFTAYYLFPFSTESFKFHMGGGAAYYFGKHIRKIGDTGASNKEREFSAGIHVTIGAEYLPKEFLSVRAEIKFRDPELSLLSRYDKAEFTYNGKSARVSRETFDSKINIDGINFSAGIVYHFNLF